MRTFSSFPKLTFAALSIGVVLSACGDDPVEGPDASVVADGGSGQDATIRPDSGPLPDSGPRPDSGAGTDGGHFCVNANREIDVDGTDVVVDPATEEPTSPTGNDSVVSCIGRQPTLMIGAPVRYRGCLSFVGATPTAQELDQLEITVFRGIDTVSGATTNPSYDPATGAERSPAAIMQHSLRTDADALFAIDPVATAQCPSGLLLEIGRNAQAAEALVTDFDFIIRARSATTAAAPVWVDTYYFGVNIRSDSLEAGSAGTDVCTPQTCSGRVNLTLFKQNAFSTLITATGENIPGAADLTDHTGAAHAMIVANDCRDTPMTSAGAGFSPEPIASSYLSRTLDFDRNATVTSSAGVFLGLGFTNTSTVYGAVAISRDGTCTEAFGGGSIRVFPDSISVLRSGVETTLR